MGGMGVRNKGVRGTGATWTGVKEGGYMGVGMSLSIRLRNLEGVREYFAKWSYDIGCEQLPISKVNGDVWRAADTLAG